jgi:NAD(P)-dependent dehydrogenase (short-subunit alcohol dehydrogenase family)
MPRLAGKIALITGAGTGIGRATAIPFAREGAKVAIADINVKSDEETTHLAGNEAIAIRADVTDPDNLQSAILTTANKFGRLDVLHNNAGGSTAQDNTAVDAPLDEFWRAIKLDLFGTFLGCRFGIPELVKAGGGSVINMSSNVALMGEGRARTAARIRAVALLGLKPAARAPWVSITISPISTRHGAMFRR